MLTDSWLIRMSPSRGCIGLRSHGPREQSQIWPFARGGGEALHNATLWVNATSSHSGCPALAFIPLCTEGTRSRGFGWSQHSGWEASQASTVPLYHLGLPFQAAAFGFSKSICSEDVGFCQGWRCSQRGLQLGGSESQWCLLDFPRLAGAFCVYKNTDKEEASFKQ